MDPMYLIVWADGEDRPEVVALDTFLEANVDDPKLCEITVGLLPGSTAHFGGGAAMKFTVTRAVSPTLDALRDNGAVPGVLA